MSTKSDRDDPMTTNQGLFLVGAAYLATLIAAIYTHQEGIPAPFWAFLVLMGTAPFAAIVYNLLGSLE